jgi:hypothetical protein
MPVKRCPIHRLSVVIAATASLMQLRNMCTVSRYQEILQIPVGFAGQVYHGVGRNGVGTLLGDSADAIPRGDRW